MQTKIDLLMKAVEIINEMMTELDAVRERVILLEMMTKKSRAHKAN